MAALAALDSLHVTLTSVDTREIEQSELDEIVSLSRTVQRLDDLRDRGIDRGEVNELEAKIRDAAWKLQDVLDALLQDEKGVEQEIRSFFNTARTLRGEYERALDHEYEKAAEKSRVALAEEEDDFDSAANSTTVGLSDLSHQIITGLIDDGHQIKVTTIWGMAGIGKTHLARDIYNHPLVVQHFELRLWLSITPFHADINNIFLDIVSQIERKPRHQFKRKKEGQLRDLARKRLHGRKYLIVLDGIWERSSVLKEFLDLQNRNILVTTRLRDADHIPYDLDQVVHSKIWQVPFLSDEESWELLWQNVFPNEPTFPPLLEKPGRKIAHLCEGLPLLIRAVADILRGLDQTEEYWNRVGERKTSTFPDAYDEIHEVLASSYDYLHQVHKRGFLYMGVFPQSHVILASRLIHLLNVEDIRGSYQMLDALVSSSLSLPIKQSSLSRIKSCKLHSTYWYVCVKEARRNRLFHVLKKLVDASIESPRRLSVQNNMLFGLKEVHGSMAASTSLTRSLLFTGDDHQYPVQICFDAMLLLKVLDALAIRFYEFPDEVANLLQLRYLTLTHNGEVPSSISRLQELRFLSLRRHHNISSMTYLPDEIWDLKKLEFLRVKGSSLPDPRHGKKLPNLSRLYVNARSCSDGVLSGTLALEKLGIEIEIQPNGGVHNSLACLEHLGIPDSLKFVKCVFVNPRFSSHAVHYPIYNLSNMPWDLTKLSLNGLGYPWDYMSIIGELRHLAVLKLRCSAFRGPDWEIKSGEFENLTYLLLEDIDVVHWTIGGRLYKLSHLIIRHCYKLKTIPHRGFSHGMERMEVDECSPSVVESAHQIKDNPPNSHCEVVINSSWNL